MNILLSSAGRRVELLQSFRHSAEEMGFPLRALAADMVPELSAACHCADKAFRVSACSSASFLEELLALCRTHNVDLLIPTIDTELEMLAANSSRFAQVGTRVAISSQRVIGIARDKLRTAEFLRGVGIRTPRTAKIEEFKAASDTWTFPVLLKPIAGSSSIGVHRVNSIDEMSKVRNYSVQCIAQELKAGVEYTVNMFFDHSGLRCAIPHRRLEVRAGEVSKARTERVQVLMQVAEQLGTALAGEAFGALCFQAIVTPENHAIVFEINARFGGGYPLAHRAGAEFTKWLLEIASGRTCTAHNNWRENVLMLRYDAAIFPQTTEGAP